MSVGYGAFYGLKPTKTDFYGLRRGAMCAKKRGCCETLVFAAAPFIKDAALTLDGTSGILSSHLDFDQVGRGWNFRSPGHGGVDFESIIRELNIIGYQGPLSVEWEDCGMNREYGAADAAKFVRKIDFPKSDIQFDAAF